MRWLSLSYRYCVLTPSPLINASLMCYMLYTAKPVVSPLARLPVRMYHASRIDTYIYIYIHIHTVTNRQGWLSWRVALWDAYSALRMHGTRQTYLRFAWSQVIVSLKLCTLGTHAVASQIWQCVCVCVCARHARLRIRTRVQAFAYTHAHQVPSTRLCRCGFARV